MKPTIALLLALVAQAFAGSNDSQQASKKAQTEVQLKLNQFARNNADYELLVAAEKLSGSLVPQGDEIHLSKLDEECLRLKLKVLLALASARDPHYDPEAPENGVVLHPRPRLEGNKEQVAAGMGPNSKDPEVRKAWEDAIAQNERRNEKLNREMAISRGMDLALMDVWMFVKQGFSKSSAAQKEAIEIVQRTISDKVLLERFKSETMPGLTW